MYFDVFNGDADGICALLQLRLAEPLESILITGVKRDIELLKRVDADAAGRVTVLDISLDKNRQPLIDLLNKDVDVFYVDHHQSGEIPPHPNLKALIDTDANVCTSLLVDQYLNHQFSAWAVTAAFGDNLEESALRLAQHLRFSIEQLQTLRQLGVGINYNSYGTSIDDLYFPPDQLFKVICSYQSPFDFVKDKGDIYEALLHGYADDIARAWQVLPEFKTEYVAVFILPDEKWARRVSGVWSNELANQYQDRAHAVLTHDQQGGYVVSVRAPISRKTGADELCAKFPGGGGRKAAAGINHLPAQRLDDFINAITMQYQIR